MVSQTKVNAGVVLILEGLFGHEWCADPNYKDTPKRVTEFYKELFNRDGQKLTVFPEKHDQMIVLSHHIDWTLCPHHLLPVKLDVSLAYIPHGSVLGLSKLVRLIRSCLDAPIMQETLTSKLANELFKITNDVAVLIYGEHLCMQMRGVRSTSRTVTSEVLGAFRDKPEVKEEFLMLVRK